MTEIVESGKALAERALAAPVGALHGRERWGNGGAVLWAGDNLEGLVRALRGDLDASVPAIEGKVDLVCTDPPYFRHLQARQRHGDLVTESVIETRAWHDGGKGGMEGHLARLYARLVLCRRLLSPRGTLYLQADRILSPWLRVLLDELFGAGNFVNEITWKRANAHNDARRFGSVCDAVLVYGKGPLRLWNPVRRDPSERETDPHWSRDAQGRLCRKVPLDAPRRGKAAMRLFAWKGRLPAPGRAWAMPLERMEELEREGRLVETAGGAPCRLVYSDETEGAALQDLWDDIPALSARSPQRQDYPAQKPEALVERMLLASSETGSWVLDPYAGSGTLGAVAARHGRNSLLMDTAPSAHLVMRRRLGESGLLLLQGQPAKALRPQGGEASDGASALCQGWATGRFDGAVFVPRESAWRERRMGRRGNLTDSVISGTCAPWEFLRTWDIEGGQGDLALGKDGAG